MVKVKGVTIEFANGPMVVPPLSLASVELLQDRLTNYSGTLKDVTLVIDSLHAALKRNYPDIAREEVADMVDVSNMKDVMMAVMNVAGLVKQGGESGEVAGGTNP